MFSGLYLLMDAELANVDTRCRTKTLDSADLPLTQLRPPARMHCTTAIVSGMTQVPTWCSQAETSARKAHKLPGRPSTSTQSELNEQGQVDYLQGHPA